MKELLEKSNVNYSRLKSFIYKVTAAELSNLAEPCYYPEHKRYFYEMLHLCGLKESDIKEFISRFYKGTKGEQFLLVKDVGSNLLLFIMYYFLQKKDQMSYSSTMTFYMIRQYSNLIRRQIKYCNPDYFRYTLDNLAKTHLFSREKTIPSALYYLSKEMQKRFTNEIKNKDPNGIIKFIQESRHRISQSIKSFGEIYYKAAKEGKGIKISKDEEEEVKYQIAEKTPRLIEDITKKITVYRQIDSKALDESRNLTKVKTSIATLIVKELSNPKYSDNVKLILTLFIQDLPNVSSLRGTDYFGYVRKLMSIKRTTKKIYFKQQVEELLNEILLALDYKSKFESQTNQTQFLFKLFLAYYITMCLRNTIL